MRRPASIMAIIATLSLLTIPMPGFSQPRGERGGSNQPAAQSPNSPQQAGAARSLETIQYSFREVAKRVLPVVVEVDVTEVVTQPTPRLQSPFDWFFNTPPQNGQGGQREFERSGLGSGVIVNRSGDKYYVLTNNHVVGEASQITVQLTDQRKFKAKLVGKDPRMDVAVVSFDSKDTLAVAELGDSDDLQVGDLVLAVGNPFGFESTLTLGIVSALGRHSPTEAAQYTDYIQTDAAINQGNSGGALVNIKGQVVGINTWIAAPTGGSVGLGFAIPINNTKKDIEGFITTGKVEYGWLGVQMNDIQDEGTYPGLAKDMKLAGVNGAFVFNIFKGSPAEKAGIIPGDYITKVAAQDIKNSSQLTQVVGGLFAGRSYDFELIRYGERQKVSVKIGVRDEKDTVAQSKNLWPGMTVINITDDIRQQVPIAAGVNGVVVGYLGDSDTPASIAGFRPGDVIVDINGKTVRNMMDYYKAINDRSKKDVAFRLNRKSTEITLGLGR